MSSFSDINARTIFVYEAGNIRGLQSFPQGATGLDLDLQIGLPSSGGVDNGVIIGGTEVPTQMAYASQENEGQRESESEPKRVTEARFSCPICLDGIKDECCTSCGHVFCRHCINLAITTRRRCPLCQKRILRRGVRRIFLPKIEN